MFKDEHIRFLTFILHELWKTYRDKDTRNMLIYRYQIKSTKLNLRNLLNDGEKLYIFSFMLFLTMRNKISYIYKLPLPPIIHFIFSDFSILFFPANYNATSCTTIFRSSFQFYSRETFMYVHGCMSW